MYCINCIVVIEGRKEGRKEGRGVLGTTSRYCRYCR